jgi:hypothetical protein
VSRAETSVAAPQDTGGGSPGGAGDRGSRCRRVWLAAVGVLAVSLAGTLILWIATSRFGIGIGNDSVIYLAGARHWLEGLGISWISGGGEVKPMVHFPPLFSLLLAGLSLLSVDMLQGARIINVLAFGLNGALLGLCLWRLTRSGVLAVAGVVLFMVTPSIIAVHSYGMTDGPFLTLSLIALYLMGSYFEQGHAWLLVASAVAVGLAYLLRYVGVTLVLLLGLGLILQPTRTWGLRLKAASAFGAIAVLPIGGWFLRNLLLTGRLSDLQILFHGDYTVGFADGFRLMLDWFLPGVLVRPVLQISGLGVTLCSLAAAGLTGIGVVLLRGGGGRIRELVRAPALLGLLGLDFGIYLVVLYASKGIMFPPARIEERTLAPAYISALVFGLVALRMLWLSKRWVLCAGAVAVYGLLLFNKVVWTANIVERLPIDGVLGYTNAAWRSSETIAALQELEPTLVYSNNVAALYLILGRYAYDLPEEIEVLRADIDPNLESLEAYRERLRSTAGSIVVLFGLDEVLPGHSPFEPFTRGLELVGTYADGAIYAAPEHDG